MGQSGSLFEAMLRGCRVALDKIGAEGLPIIVGETGWPSDGGSKGMGYKNIFFTKYSISVDSVV